jgi:hypothetical protein
MSPDEFAGTVSGGTFYGQHGEAIQMAVNILGQLLD